MDVLEGIIPITGYQAWLIQIVGLASHLEGGVGPRHHQGNHVAIIDDLWLLRLRQCYDMALNLLLER
jgi:hypothetical protein